jgi:hypothetical protein
MGIMHQCFIISGMRPEGALLRVLAFYEGLGEERQGKLLAVLGARDSEGNKVVDNADDFARFLTRGAGAPEIEKQHQAALILKLERVERAYNYRQVSADLFDEAGNPRMIELGLAKMRELAHGDVSPRTYSNAIEELAAWRVASEMQEGGIELVMGFLGRAGLVEQLLMAAAENVPTAELKKPFADLSRCFKSQRFSAVVTPELKRLEARWKAAGAPLARLTDLVNKPQVPLPQLRGAVREFQDALDAFLTDARRTMREVAERKQAVIIAERKADEEATGKSPNTGRSATFEQLQADLAVISEAVDNFTVATFSSLEHPAGRLPSFNKVWNVVMQRLISNETLHLVLLNELLDPYGGKTRDFRELLLAGKSLHVTSNLGAWLSHVTHCIQALPAYAWYDIIDLPGDNYEIMAACKRDFLEVMFKGNIEAIAEDIEDVMHSEHVAIARSILARRMNLTGQIDRIVEALKTRGEDVDASREEAIRLIMDRRGLREAVENLATLVEATYGNLEEEIGRYMVNNGVERVVALDMIIHENNTEANLVRGFCAATPASDLNGEATRQEAAESVTAHQLSPTREIMKGRAFLRRRDLPCFHNLTTLGPGETTTFLKTWLETGLSLHLFCQDNGLEDRVKTRLAEYNSRMGHAAWRVIEELGMQGLFFKEMAQKGLDPTSEADRIEAAPDFIAQYPTASIEVGRICAIMEYEEKTRGIAKGEDHFKKEPVLVAEYLKDKRKAQEIENQANEQVVAQYDYDHGTRIMAAVK